MLNRLQKLQIGRRLRVPAQRRDGKSTTVSNRSSRSRQPQQEDMREPASSLCLHSFFNRLAGGICILIRVPHCKPGLQGSTFFAPPLLDLYIQRIRLLLPFLFSFLFPHFFLFFLSLPACFFIPWRASEVKPLTTHSLYSMRLLPSIGELPRSPFIIVLP